MPSERPRLRLGDIAENIRAIFDYTAGMDSIAFGKDRKSRDAVERCLLRIAEAAIKLGSDAEEWMPDQNWRGIRGIGNVLRHEYDGVDPAIIWTVIADDLPGLLGDVEATMERLEGSGRKEP